MYTFEDIERQAKVIRTRMPGITLGKSIMYALHELDPHLYHETVNHPERSCFSDERKIPVLRSHVEKSLMFRTNDTPKRPIVIDFRYA